MYSQFYHHLDFLPKGIACEYDDNGFLQNKLSLCKSWWHLWAKAKSEDADGSDRFEVEKHYRTVMTKHLLWSYWRLTDVLIHVTWIVNVWPCELNMCTMSKMSISICWDHHMIVLTEVAMSTLYTRHVPEAASWLPSSRACLNIAGEGHPSLRAPAPHLH